MAQKRARPPVAPWGSRIVRTGKARAADLLAHPQNWRIHGRAQQKAITQVLAAVGFVQGVIVNLRTSRRWPNNERGVETLLDGHLRVGQALSRDEDTEIPVVYVDLDPEEERLVLATFDPIGSMAGRDDDVLNGLVADVSGEFEDVDISAILKRGRTKVEFETGAACNVLVLCGDSETQDALIRKLTDDGYVCKPTSRS